MLPRELGFRMPAEWERKSRTFMEWPMRQGLWPDGFQEAREGYAQVAKAISQFEEVVMVVQQEYVEEAQQMCGDGVKVLPLEHDDSWMRDNGPTFVVNKEGKLSAINWKFNAWGQKFFPYDKDDQIAKLVAEHYGVPVYDAPLVLEGGSIHVDGEGTLLTTAECLLNSNRNPDLTKDQIQENLKQYLGVEQFIWLKRGLYGDDTDGHVDNIACFAKPGTVVLQVCNDPSDPNYEITQENLKILANSFDAKGRAIEVVQIEQPPVRYHNGVRLTLSYLNYYPVNGGIIVPVFGGDAQESDAKAIEVLQKIYPDRKIVPVDGMPIIKGGGNVHCITQQMPVGK